MTISSHSATPELANYRIRVSGCVSEWWISRYLDMTNLETHRGTTFTVTEMTGTVKNQECLINLLNLLYDMRHVLISVERINAEQVNGITPEG